MKAFKLFLKFFFLALALSLPALEPRAGLLGLGIQVGSLPGADLKFWTSHDNAIQLSLGSSDANSISLEGSDVWHLYGVFDSDRTGPEPFVPVYAGLGGMIASIGPGGIGNSAAQTSIHGVTGVNYIVEGRPFDLYLEILPTLFLTPMESFSLRTALGARCYF